MNRLYVGSKGDYGTMNIYALGYIDNVRADHAGCSNPRTHRSYPGNYPDTHTLLKIPAPKQTLTVPTPYPTSTQKSPAAGILAIGAIGIVMVMYGVLTRIKRD